jgi:hypothetical protein
MKRLIFTVLIVIFCLIGEVLCIFKMIRCNWEPVGKAEIVYTVGVFTGTGAIVGWINIEDK